MTDKVQKIREEVKMVVNRRLNLLNGDYFNLIKETDSFTNEIMDIIDSMQEEPVSEDLMDATNNYCVNVRKGYPRIMDETDRYICNAFKAGAKWQKLQDMGITNKAQDVVDDVLSSADSPLDAYATEVAFTMLPATLKESYHQTNRDRISDAVRLGAKWQKENLWKPADGEDLPKYEREVIILIQDNAAGIMRIAIAHRPNPKGYDGKSITTGKVEHYTPKTYDKGGWNIPDVRYWLDIDLPKLEED